MSTLSRVKPTGAAHPPPAPGHDLVRLLLWAVLAALLIGSWKGVDMRPLELMRDSGNMATYAASFFPPDFIDWRIYLQELLIALQIALWGTVLAVIFAVPFGLLCSSNITPAWIRQPVRRLMDAARAINEMVVAMLFVVAVGMLGAGGIGVILWEVIRGFQYAQTCAVLMMIVVTVTAIDLLSSQMRKNLDLRLP